MSKSLTRKIFLSALVIEIPSIIVTILSQSMASIAATFILLALIAQLSTWVGALVKTTELKQWGWFSILLLTGVIGVLAYILAGPETPHRIVV